VQFFHTGCTQLKGCSVTYWHNQPKCRSMGAVGTTMVSSLLVPLSIIAFTFVPASYLPPPVLSQNFVLGACVLVCGQLLFNLPTLRAAFSQKQKLTWVRHATDDACASSWKHMLWSASSFLFNPRHSLWPKCNPPISHLPIEARVVWHF